MQLKWSLGFGLERLGLWALRWPRISTALLLFSIVLSVSLIPRIGFDGNVVSVLNAESKPFRDFVRQATSFHDFSGDVSVVVQNDQLKSAKVFEELRNTHLDLSLEEGIESVFSVFTLGEAVDASGAAPLLPEQFESDKKVAEALANLLQREPASGAILAPDSGAMLILVRLADQEAWSEKQLASELEKLRAKVVSLAPAGTTVTLSGMQPIRAAIVSAIIQDQTVLTGAGILLGCMVAWFIFRSVAGAVICTVPAFLTVLWVLSIFAYTGVPLNFFTTALPTLGLIVAFADTIVLNFRWQSLNAEGPDSLDHLKSAISSVGPASSLTSITTALAFGSFAWAASDTMDTLAFFGVVTVVCAFLAVILGLPIAGYWLVRWRGSAKQSNVQKLSGQGDRLARIVTRAPVTTLIIACVLVGLSAIAHMNLRPSYTLSEYLPNNSEIRSSERYVDTVFGGTSQIYVLLPITEGGSFTDEENRARLVSLDTTVASIFGEKQTLSLASAWKRMDETDIVRVEEGLDEVSDAVRGRFISQDRRTVQVAAATSAGASTLKVEAQVDELRREIERLPFGDEVAITGLSVLLSKEFPKLIEELRTGLLVSIFLSVVVIAIATRNPALALASLVPNLLPILFTEAVMWVFGASLSVTNVIALTIAFGIAIDNAVHVINAYEANERRNMPIVDRVRQAVGAIAPALVASTTIICVATLITQFSSMPSVSELGLLLMATLIVALISNLAILPSAMIVILMIARQFGRGGHSGV